MRTTTVRIYTILRPGSDRVPVRPSCLAAKQKKKIIKSPIFFFHHVTSPDSGKSLQCSPVSSPNTALSVCRRLRSRYVSRRSVVFARRWRVSAGAPVPRSNRPTEIQHASFPPPRPKRILGYNDQTDDNGLGKGSHEKFDPIHVEQRKSHCLC